MHTREARAGYLVHRGKQTGLAPGRALGAPGDSPTTHDNNDNNNVVETRQQTQQHVVEFVVELKNNVVELKNLVADLNTMLLNCKTMFSQLNNKLKNMLLSLWLSLDNIVVECVVVCCWVVPRCAKIAYGTWFTFSVVSNTERPSRGT